MREKNIVLFDMDNTLVSEDTVKLWGDFLYQRGVIDAANNKAREDFHLQYLAGKLDIVANYRHEIATIKKIHPHQREEIRQTFFETLIKPKISPKGLQIIEEYRKQPDTIIILMTATLAFIAHPVAVYAKVHNLIATDEEIVGGDFTGEVWGIPNIGEGKVKRFKRWLTKHHIRPLQTILYTDSHNDLPLLYLVQKPIIVDPDETLKDIAIKNHWEIISLKNPDVDVIHQ